MTAFKKRDGKPLNYKWGWGWEGGENMMPVGRITFKSERNECCEQFLFLSLGTIL